MGQLVTKDILVFLFYFVIVALYGYWIYQRKKNTHNDSKDFFLAEGSLTWWAIGASLIASNISAEQFIGMSGSGFALGLGIASYEWMAAATLIIVAIFFMPLYLRNKIYTMPQFLRQRYDGRVSTIMAVFWLLLYVLVNLTSIIYLGALSLQHMLDAPFMWCALGLVVFAIFITLGGMRVIGYTDVIQVFFLILGGLATTYLALNLVSDKVGTGAGVMEGLSLLKQKAPDHFHMIFQKGKYLVHDGQGGMQDPWQQLPGLAVLIGGMWIANLSYWGCNQYITQRALGANLPTARRGLLFAAFLKLLMPVIVVLPGIACYVLYNSHADPHISAGIMEANVVKPDNAYSILLNLLPAGLKGLAFAALTAAIVASLAGKANSISTIFSLDIYKRFINKDADDKTVVRTGRWVVIIAFAVALAIAPALKSFGQGFNYIQEFTGFISPGILAMFLMGFFWKRSNSNGAMAATLISIPLSAVLKYTAPSLPFMNRMSIVFIACLILIIIFGLLDPKSKNNPKALEVKASMFRLPVGFAVGVLLVLGVIAALYLAYW
ncbi:MAG TPA: sodium/sugar symporter [Chitinophagaceae bacterium]|jgi:SSS family solute:Na+ symporter|nr:sodium/sugar symporter [Chitinophagaceae bacterium]